MQEVAYESRKKLYSLESVVHQKIDKNLDSFESNLEEKSLKMRQKNGSWKIPFVILFFLIIGSCFLLYLFYSKIVKKMSY